MSLIFSLLIWAQGSTTTPTPSTGSSIDLLRLIPEGTNIIGVIVVVVLFLKQQEKFNTTMSEVTKQFNEQVKENQAAFQAQLSDLTGQYSANQKLYQDQIQKLMDGHIQVTREVIVTLQDVKHAVANISQRQLEDYPATRGRKPPPAT